AAQVQAPGTNDHGGIRDVLAAGEGQTVNTADFASYTAGGVAPDAFTSQAGLYSGLIAATPNLDAAAVDRFFKPEGFGAAPADVVSTTAPRAGTTIVRDRSGVPHIYGDSRASTMFGAGYATAQERLF